MIVIENMSLIMTNLMRITNLEGNLHEMGTNSFKIEMFLIYKHIAKFKEK